MTFWRYLQAAHVTEEAGKALEEAGMDKLKYRAFVGRIFPEEQLAAVAFLIEQRNSKKNGKTNRIIDAYSAASKQQRSEFLDWLGTDGLFDDQ